MVREDFFKLLATYSPSDTDNQNRTPWRMNLLVERWVLLPKLQEASFLVSLKRERL
jgi:hypothetical protein